METKSGTPYQHWNKRNAFICSFFNCTGRSTESTKMNTFSGLKNGNEKFYPYLSTSHYMRTAMGTEKPGKYEDPTGEESYMGKEWKGQIWGKNITLCILDIYTPN